MGGKEEAEPGKAHLAGQADGGAHLGAPPAAVVLLHLHHLHTQWSMACTR